MSRRKIGLLVVAGIVLLVTGSVYVFIPGELIISASRLTSCNVNAAYRSISDKSSWKKWWPEDGINGYRYRIPGKAYPQTGVILEPADGTAGSDSGVTGALSVLTTGLDDSVTLIWQCRVLTGWDPFTRYRHYREAVRIHRTMAAGLSLLGPFLKKLENVYGMEIRDKRSQDSLLVVAQLMTEAYPSTAAIYGAVRRSREYISGQGAKETDYPMLHVTLQMDSVYLSTIAIPVDRELKGTKELTLQRFVPWKVLSAEVRGGPYTVERAMDQLQLFVIDHQKTPMAMPFQSLVTERDQEPDTSRWITRVIQSVP